MSAAACAPSLRRTLLALVLALAGCGDPGHGPAHVTFGRDACEHCGMVISDRRFAAQVRVGRTPHRFDDLGCALEWLDEHPVPGGADEIWVMAGDTGEWIDGRSASYRGGQRTPMGYGFAAEAAPAPGALTLDAVRTAIHEARARRTDGPRKP